METLTRSEIFQLVCGVVGFVITVLLGGNLFFLRKALNKVELIAPLVAKMETITGNFSILCGKVESLNSLKTEVAVMQDRLLRFQHSRHGSNGELTDEEEFQA